MRKTIPDATDKLFVTDRKKPCYELPLTAVLLNDPEIPVREVMDSDPATFSPKTRPMKRPARSNVTT